MKVLARDATPADTAPVAHLLTQRGYPSTPQETAERLSIWSHDVLGRVLVAEADGTIAGILAFHAIPFLEHDGRRGRIVCLVVDASARRCGIGEELMRAAEAEARRQRCIDIEVTSARTRTDQADDTEP